LEIGEEDDGERWRIKGGRSGQFWLFRESNMIKDQWQDQVPDTSSLNQNIYTPLDYTMTTRFHSPKSGTLKYKESLNGRRNRGTYNYTITRIWNITDVGNTWLNLAPGARGRPEWNSKRVVVCRIWTKFLMFERSLFL
jgi:hypothetical protein